MRFERVDRFVTQSATCTLVASQHRPWTNDWSEEFLASLRREVLPSPGAVRAETACGTSIWKFNQTEDGGSDNADPIQFEHGPSQALSLTEGLAGSPAVDVDSRRQAQIAPPGVRARAACRVATTNAERKSARPPQAFSLTAGLAGPSAVDIDSPRQARIAPPGVRARATCRVATTNAERKSAGPSQAFSLTAGLRGTSGANSIRVNARIDTRPRCTCDAQHRVHPGRRR